MCRLKLAVILTLTSCSSSQHLEVLGPSSFASVCLPSRYQGLLRPAVGCSVAEALVCCALSQGSQKNWEGLPRNGQMPFTCLSSSSLAFRKPLAPLSLRVVLGHPVVLTSVMYTLSPRSSVVRPFDDLCHSCSVSHLPLPFLRLVVKQGVCCQTPT